jgi:hypothetical protein
MAQIINLRSARKAKAREDQRAKADENAAKHGRSKAEKTLVAARMAKENRDLDGHERE